jgi:hypothetical protein
LPTKAGSLSPFAAAGLYLLLAILLVWPVVDLVVNTWPPRPMTLMWRYGFFGLASGFVHTPLLALGLGVVVSNTYAHRRMLRVVAVICLLGALALLGVCVIFPLDAMDAAALRGSSMPAVQASLQTTGAVIAVAKHATGAIALLLLGIGGWRSSGR